MKSFNEVKNDKWEKKPIKQVLSIYWQPGNYERRTVKLI